jgi:hypothetical protein
VVGLEWPWLRSLGIGRQLQRCVCVGCKATGYAREGLPLCDGARNAVARAPEYKRTGLGDDKARVQVKVEVAVGSGRRAW